MLIGCDLHASQQSIAMLDRDTGAVTETLIGRPASLAWREFARVIMVRCDRRDVWCRHRRDASDTDRAPSVDIEELRRQSHGRLRRLFGL